MKIATLQFFTLFALILAACNQTPENAAPVDATAAPPASASAFELPAASRKQPVILYAQVDKLNIREKPSDSGKVIAQAVEGEALAYKGEVTDFKEKKVLRGVEYNQPWIKVSTKERKEGWVYGGGVSNKRAAATESNSPEDSESPPDGPDAAASSAPAQTTSAPKVNYPHFGSYDLSTWTKVSSTKPDRYTTEERYTKDGMTMIIRKSDYGKSSYDYACELYGPDNLLMKSHTLNIYERTEEDRGLHLREEVLDFESNPPKSYSKYRGNNINVQDFDPKDLSATKKRGSLPGEFESGTIPQDEIGYKRKRLE